MLWQRIFRPKIGASYTHVLLMCTNTFAIHATPVGGVSFIGLYDLLCTSEYKNSWKIYRNLEIENFTKEDFLSAHKKINEASMYFFLQKYNYAFNIPEPWYITKRTRKSFCSQLISRIFARINIDLDVTNKNPSLVLPADIELSTKDQSKWREVTHIYTSRIDDANKSKALLLSIINSEMQDIELYQVQSKFDTTVQNHHARELIALQQFEETVNKLDQIIHSVNSAFDPNIHPRKPYKFPTNREEYLRNGSIKNWITRDIYRKYLTGRYIKSALEKFRFWTKWLIHRSRGRSS